MRYLLDTTLLIDHANGRPSAVELVEQLFSEPNDLLICDIVVAEALSAGSDHDQELIHMLIQALEYVATPPEAAIWAAESRRRRDARGGRSLADAVIAGLAWFTDAIVVTRNPHDFEIQGVRVLGYQ